MMLGESFKRKENDDSICLLDLSFHLFFSLSLLVKPQDTKASTHKVYTLFSAFKKKKQYFHLVIRVSH